MKKILTTILIAALVTTALLTASELLESDRNYTVKAVNNYSATIGYPGIDNYSFCYHTNAYYTNDMCVGMGIMAYYDTSHGDSSPYRYKWARWSFFSALGWGGSKDPYIFYYPLIDNIQNCYSWWKINGIWNEHYYDANVAPYWQGSGYNQYVMDPWYPSPPSYNPYSFYPNYATTICGKIGQYFQYYWPPYPPYVVYIEVQVQPFDIVTASPGPPTPTSGPIYP